MNKMSHKIVLLHLVMIFAVATAMGQTKEDSYNIQRGVENLYDHETSSALEWFEKEIRENPSNAYAFYYLAFTLSWDDEHGKALKAVNQAIPLMPKKDKKGLGLCYGLRARITMSLGDYASSLTDYAQAIKLNPKDASLYTDRGDVYYQLERYDLSNEDYLTAIKLDPGDAVGYLRMGRNFIALKEYDLAIKSLDYAIKLDGNNARSYAFRAEAYMEKKMWNEATDDIVQALLLDRSDRKALYLMFNLSDEAAILIQAKLQIQANKNPHDPMWYVYIGGLYEKKNLYREAISYYKQANERDVAPFILEYISNCYFQLGYYQQALVYVNKAIAIDEKEEDFVLLKGNIYNEMGNQAEAVKVMDQYIIMEPEHYYGYYRRGWFKDNQGDHQGAINDYTLSIALNPQYAYAYEGRGRCYELSGQHDKAVTDFKKVIELDTVPESGSCAQYAYFYLGEKEKAKAFMQRYLDNAEENDMDGGHYDAACLYSLMGETDKALEHLRQSLERGYRRFAHIESDRDLENIRSLSAFKTLIKEYKQKHEAEEMGSDQSNLNTPSFDQYTEIPFYKEGGVTKVKCVINEVPLHFIFDTGASDVSMSLVEANFMWKNGYIKQEDIVGTTRYKDANGDISEGTTINLRSVKFGGLELNNVKASIVRNQKAPLLLGQSVLGRLGSIEIDNQKAVLKIRR